MSDHQNSVAMPSWDALVIEGAFQQRPLASALEGAGHKVRIVSSGLDALRAYLRRRPDLVFIDLHLPAAGGMPTTMLLRGLERDGGHVPIIATTGQAPGGEGDRFLTADVDAYLPEPFEIDTLHRVVKTLRAAMIPAHARSTAAARDSSHTSIGRLPTVDMVAALGRLGGDKSLLADLVQFFFEDAFPLLIGIHEAIDQKNWDNARRRAHSLKGLAANFSALDAVSALQAIETCDDGAESTMSDASREVDGEIARLAAALADYSEGRPEHP